MIMKDQNYQTLRRISDERKRRISEAQSSGDANVSNYFKMRQNIIKMLKNELKCVKIL